jgi:CheY-like chemotaxis protein
VGLPDINGLALARHMRTRGGPTLTLVAITGYGDERTRAEALRAGCNDVLLKPVDQVLLRRALER